MDHIKELMRAIDEADHVLVGLGEDVQFDWSFLENDARYNQLMEQIGDDTRYDLLIACIQRYLVNKYAECDVERYNLLAKRLEQKNYFIVSLGVDDLVYKSLLRSDRIVTPCGGFRKLQCPDHCTAELWEPDEILMKQAADAYESGVLPETINKIVCPHCGKQLVFNQMGNGKYCEEGYLEQWNIYMKWLQGTMNRTVCMIELGVGMQFPSVIRWPFEKLAFYNRKAKMFRIHSTLFQIGDEISERAWGIQADAKEFMNNLEMSDGR